MRKLWRWLVDFFSSIGGFPGEPVEQRSKRIIFVVASTIATLLTIPSALDLGSQGFTKSAVALWFVVAVGLVGGTISVKGKGNMETWLLVSSG